MNQSGQGQRWQPRRVQVGDWTITALSDGFMRLDGGAMWGVVPKNLWGKLTPAAPDNTILLALRPFLCERGDDKVVIEVGLGDRWEDKWKSIYHIDRSDTLVSSLAACGVAPEEVTHVIASHCHFDHIGAMVSEVNGELVPTFPKALHKVPAIELEMARNPDHVRRASYRSDDILPVEAAGLLGTYEGRGEGEELLDGIRAHCANGHSDGVSVITINEGVGEESDTAIFWADVVPTTHHIQPAFIMAYDIDVALSFNNRSQWLERAQKGNWMGLFYHDADHPFGRLRKDGRRYTCVLEG